LKGRGIASAYLLSSEEIRNQGPARNARSKLGGSSTWFALIEDEDDDENEDDNERAVKRESAGARPGKASKKAPRISILYDIHCMML
jgi:hypothetical protein